jgi:colicin import membrane protein
MRISNRGITGTVIFHGLILALLILGSLTFPDPPPEEEGVLVNFGTDDTGFGSVEPIGDQTNQGTPEPEAAEPVPVRETYVPPTPTPVVKSPDQTQDIEEVVVKEDPKPTAEEIRRKEEQAELIRKQQEDERIKQQEERIRREEAERIRREEEAERKRIEEERLRREQQADRLNRMGESTFGRQGVGEQQGSEGVTPGTGTNQGAVTGTPGATTYGDGTGLGDSKNYGLGNRTVVGTLPPPIVDDCSVTSRIIVTVEIQVDRSGSVVGTSIKDATFSDPCINNAVLAAARKTRFTGDQNAAFRQTGWIRYTIEP